MHKKRVYSLGLLAVISLVTGCAQLPGLNRSPQVATAPEPAAVTKTSEVTDLSRRVTTLENLEVRRNLAQDDAGKIGRSAAVTQAPPKSLACVKVPPALKQSAHYTDFARLMEAVYTTSCLYEVDRLAETQAVTNKPVPPVQSPPAVKAVPKKK